MRPRLVTGMYSRPISVTLGGWLHTMLLRIIECPQIRLVERMLIAVLYSLVFVMDAPRLSCVLTVVIQYTVVAMQLKQMEVQPTTSPTLM